VSGKEKRRKKESTGELTVHKVEVMMSWKIDVLFPGLTIIIQQDMETDPRIYRGG